MVRLDSHGDCAAWRDGTVRFPRARLTVFHRELDLDRVIVVVVNGWGPADTVLSRLAPHLLGLPMDLETGQIAWLGQSWCRSGALAATSLCLGGLDGSLASRVPPLCRPDRSRHA